MGMLRAVTMAFLATWGLATVPARADGPPPGPAAPAPYPPYDAAPVPGFFDFNWSGFYVGGHLGGGHTNLEARETDFGAAETDFEAPAPDFDATATGFVPDLPFIDTYGQDAVSAVGGVQAGWQKQWEKAVAGIEVTYTALSFDETEESPLVSDLTRSGEVSNLITLTGRLGYADGRWLAYAKGGWASADIDVTYRDALTGEVTSSGDRESGWTAGVGIDYALSYNLFLGVEYNYLHFNADVPQPPVQFLETGDADVDIQTLLVRLNYRFGGPLW